MGNRTMKIEINTQTLAALTDINRTSIASIFKLAEEKYSLQFEKDSRGKTVYTEQDYELLKKIKKLKDKTKWTYEQCLQHLYEAGELDVHKTTESEKEQAAAQQTQQEPEYIAELSAPPKATPVDQLQIEFQAQSPLSPALSDQDRDRILEQIRYLENFLHFVRNDVQTAIQHLYHSIDAKFTEKGKELQEVKETLTKAY